MRSEAGAAEMRLLGDPGRHTLGDLAERVIGPGRTPGRIGVDEQVHPPDMTLNDAGVRRGSVIDFAPPPAARSRSTAGHLVQVAGHGAGATVDLQDGVFRLGPTPRAEAAHLQPGPVTDAVVQLRVQGQLVEVEPIGGVTATLTGRRLTSRRAWTTGQLVVADRVFVRSRHPDPPATDAAEDRRHLMPIPVGQSLDRQHDLVGDGSDSHAHDPSIVTVDPVGGLGIVAEHEDAIAILRGIVIELADRSWPHGTALGIRTARPGQWEWTKWLPSVDTPSVEPGTTTSRTRPSRHVVVIDDGTAEEDDRHRHADYVVVIAAAPTQDRLAPGLSTVVHAVGGDHFEPPSAVSVTAIADGSVVVHPRVAPYALPEEVAVHRARRMTNRTTPEPSPSPPSDAELRLIPWTVARAPTAWERLLERRSRPATTVRADRPERTWPRRAVRAADHRPATGDEPAEDPVEPYERLMSGALIDDQRIVLPIGIWAERSDVASIPLHAGRRLAVVGPRRSGRSELLATMAEGARRAGADIDVFAVAPRGGALVEAGAELGVDVANGPAEVAAWCDRIEAAPRPLVFVDGADRVGGPSFVRLAGADFDHAAVVLTLDEEPTRGHWSDPWADGRLTIRLDRPTESAVFDARHRARRFDIVRRPVAAPASSDVGDEGGASHDPEDPT